MPRAGISYGILTTQNQGGGVKKQGLPPNIGKNQFNFRLIKRKAYPSKQPEAEAEAGCPEKIVPVPFGTQYTSNASLEIFRGCTKIIGSLRISGSFQPTFSIFDCLEEITGSFYIESNTSLTSISGFGALKSVGTFFYINDNSSLTSISGFGRLRTVGTSSSHSFNIGFNASLTSVSGFENLLTISGFFSINDNPSLTGVSGFGNLTSIGEYFGINQNTLLTNISGFGNLLTVGGYFQIAVNASITSISGFGNLTSVGGAVFQIINNTLLTNISGFESFQTVGGNFLITSNGTTASPIANNVVTTVTGFGNLTVPNGITGDLTLQGISSIRLLGIASAIVTNLTAATTGTVNTTNLYTA